MKVSEETYYTENTRVADFVLFFYCLPSPENGSRLRYDSRYIHHHHCGLRHLDIRIGTRIAVGIEKVGRLHHRCLKDKFQ
mmetsp:Transcript_11802/g.14747  ORF Transcript_11802/g.14747 Transcript_11802/m.14747 type:complete len:80 (-) Transcript_11802:590-829(-)